MTISAISLKERLTETTGKKSFAPHPTQNPVTAPAWERALYFFLPNLTLFQILIIKGHVSCKYMCTLNFNQRDLISILA